MFLALNVPAVYNKIPLRCELCRVGTPAKKVSPLRCLLSRLEGNRGIASAKCSAKSIAKGSSMGFAKASAKASAKAFARTCVEAICEGLCESAKASAKASANVVFLVLKRC